ncbi:MAG: outer membrane protein assembly factor BamA [Candidatus Binatia bacterium]
MVGLAVVGLALHSPVAAQNEAAPAEGTRIERVVITGNQRVEEEAIRVKLKTAAGEPYNAQIVDDDLRAIYKLGFFNDVRASLDRQPDGWVLTYAVQERPFIRQVQIEGNKKIDTDDIEGMIRVRPNTILDPQKARQGIEEVKNAYEKKGYLDAQIRYDTAPVGENEVDVTFVIDEREPIRIKQIVIEGNEEVDDDQLKRVMQTSEKNLLTPFTGAGNLDREVLKTDVERLTAYYYETGHIDVRVAEPEITREEDGLKVTIKVDEGARYSFGKVRTAGETDPELEKATEREFKAKEGELFRPSLLREDINDLTQTYGDLGYAFVNVTPDTKVNPADKTVDVTYALTRGPEVAIDRIEISGNTKTRDKVIRRELELQEQEQFSGSKLRRSQDRLRRLGYFEDVNITTRKADTEDKLDLIVDVREGNTGAFSAGAGVSSGESFLFNVRLSESNLFGRGQSVVLNADFGAIRRNLSFSFTEPYFLDTELTAGFDIFNWELFFEEFARGGTGATLRTLYPFPAMGLDVLRLGPLGEYSLLDTRLGVEYRIEDAEIFDVSRGSPAIIQAEQGSSLISSLAPRIFRDTRNSLLDPTAGGFQDFSVEIAGLGGDAKFINAQSRTRWYIPVWRVPKLGQLIASTGWTLGFGYGYGDDIELPLFERYFPGGINSLRGFDVRSLGPAIDVFEQGKGKDGNCPLGPGNCARLFRHDPIGGSQQLIFTNELIFPIIEALGVKGVVFFDAGNAFLASKGIELQEMRMSVGGGIRWLSPMGPLRVELGFPLNAERGDEVQTIQFSFGAPP